MPPSIKPEQNLFSEPTSGVFLDVVLPLNIRGLYTYSVPQELINEVEIGKRVVVQFGKSKLYSALIIKIHDTPPQLYKTKNIEYILDQSPIVTLKQIELWTWLSGYYMVSMGEIYRAALPAGLKLESEINISFNQHFNTLDNLLPKEKELIYLLQKTDFLSLNEASKMVNRKNILPLIKSLQQKSAITISEDFKQKYKPKLVSYVQITKAFSEKENLEKAFKLCQRSPQQENALLWYLKESKCFGESPYRISKKAFLDAGFSRAILNALMKKGILELIEEEIGRFIINTKINSNKKVLSEAQETAYQSCIQHFEKKKPVLLFGQTASGKTEIYIHLIEKALTENKTCLYLLPEIALSSQITERLSSIFGDKIIIYHSKLSDNQRVEIWKELLKGPDSKYKIVLGVRSSIFLPFSNLGLIIVDEEHENSYKQTQPAPRYQARDCSIVLANQFDSNIILGSATPSIESYYNCQIKKFALVELFQRHQNIPAPLIEVIDTKEAIRKKEMHSHFSKNLLRRMAEILAEKKQIILFQNRKGYAPLIECQDCGWVPECEHCNVNLTYYKQNSDLKCHYCGYNLQAPKKCLACGGTNLKTKGFGTEKIEDEIKIYFPEARIARLDFESTRQKNAAQEIIHAFEHREIDILVGTQMVSKGLNFSNVKLAVVLNADSLLNFPDFRAEERCFQMSTQVVGRAGRFNEQGLAQIQTMQTKHPIIEEICQNNFVSMYERQIAERQIFAYPPFTRLIDITLKHKSEELVLEAAELLCKELRNYLKQLAILGPQSPAINRIQNKYLQNILIKLPKNQGLQNNKNLIINRVDAIKSVAKFRSINIIIDVDPM